jgi:hypothetical protein
MRSGAIEVEEGKARCEPCDKGKRTETSRCKHGCTGSDGKESANGSRDYIPNIIANADKQSGERTVVCKR